MVTRGDPWYDTPRAGTLWQAMTHVDQIAAVSGAMAEKGWAATFHCLSAVRSGDVTLEMVNELSAADRGKALRQVEADLRTSVEPQIEVWLQPKVDKNAARVKLRGVLNL